MRFLSRFYVLPHGSDFVLSFTPTPGARPTLFTGPEPLPLPCEPMTLDGLRAWLRDCYERGFRTVWRAVDAGGPAVQILREAA